MPLHVQALGLTPRVFHHLFARMEAAQKQAQVLNALRTVNAAILCLQ